MVLSSPFKEKVMVLSQGVPLLLCGNGWSVIVEFLGMWRDLVRRVWELMRLNASTWASIL